LGSGKSALPSQPRRNLRCRSRRGFPAARQSLRHVRRNNDESATSPRDFSLSPLTVWQQLLFAKSPRQNWPVIGSRTLVSRNSSPAFLRNSPAVNRQRVALAQVLCSFAPGTAARTTVFCPSTCPFRQELRPASPSPNERPASHLIVTHDPEEAAVLSTKWSIISKGRVLASRVEPPGLHPTGSLEVARLLGHLEPASRHVVTSGFSTPNGALIATNPSEPPRRDDRAWSVRPERISIVATSDADNAFDEPPRASLNGDPHRHCRRRHGSHLFSSRSPPNSNFKCVRAIADRVSSGRSLPVD